MVFGGEPDQHGDGQLDDGESGVVPRDVLRHDLRGPDDRARNQRRVSRRHRRDGRGGEIPAEHIWLELQGRVEQPHRAKEQLQRSPRWPR